MAYPKNQLSVMGAKIKSIETRQIQGDKQITTVNCYEYQGSKNDKPEGIYWSVELWDKSAQYFLEKQPQEGDYVSFMGSIIDKSYQGKDGKTVYRQGVRVNQIEILRPYDNQNAAPAQTAYQPQQQRQPAQFRTQSKTVTYITDEIPY